MPMQRSNLKRGRRARTFKKRMIRNIPRVQQSCKSTLIDDGTAVNPATTKTLYNKLISNISQGDLRDQRERDLCWISGFRIRMTFHNRTLIPQTVNVAIVSPKDPYPDENAPALNTFNDGAFFTNLGVGSRTGLTANTLLNGIEWATLPISTDNHNIIWHTRFKLGVQSTQENFSSGELKNYRYLGRYIKVGKRVAFKNTAGNSCEAPMYLLVWTSQFHEAAGAGVPQAMNWGSHITTYFRDPKN